MGPVPANQKKFLLWDFDGTLASREGGWTGALLSVLRQHAPEIQVTAEQIRPFLQSGFPWHAPENAHPGLTPDEWWEDLLPVFARAFRAAGVDNGSLYRLAQEVRQVYLDPRTWQRYSDSLPALETLSSRGWKHVLLTNHVPELPALLDQSGLASHFAALFNSAQTGYEKPNPKAFRHALDWAGPDAHLCMVGDSFKSDVLGAQEVNLPAILVRNPHPEAPVYYPTLAEMAEHL